MNHNEHVGTDYNIDLQTITSTGIAAGALDPSPFVTDDPAGWLTFAEHYFEAGQGVVEHLPENYLQSILAIATSNAFSALNDIKSKSIIIGDNNENTISENTADSIILGMNGDDSITGGGGNDVIDGGAGVDTAVYRLSSTHYKIDVVGGNVTVTGKSDIDLAVDGSDTLFNIESLQFSDKTIRVFNGDDNVNTISDLTSAGSIILGKNGGDVITGGAGDDLIDGGDGTDTAVFQLALGNQTAPGQFDGYYSLTRHGQTLTVTAKPGAPSLEGNDTLYNVELLKFSDKTININDLRDLSGQTTTGGRPTDGGNATSGATVSGHELSTGGTPTGETIVGDDTSENLGGTSGPDILIGNGGDDVLTGYGSQDTFDGGAGSDTVDYSYESAGVNGTIDLAAGTAVFAGFYTEQLTSIENIWMGAGNDTVYGDAGDNDLRGGPGDDTLRGGLGNDRIYGDWKYSDQGGNDTAILSYTFGSGYTVSGSANALHIIGAEGDDWYYNVENFELAGGVIKSGEQLLQASQSAPVRVGSEIQVSSTNVYSFTEAPVALNDGGFLATWSFHNNDFSHSGMGGQRFDANGSKVGNEFEYQFSGASSTNYSVATAGLGDGTSVVVWNNGQILGQRLSENGTPIGPEFQVSTAHGGDDPAIAYLQDGKLVVTWHSSGSGGNEIFGQLFNADGSKAGSEFLVSDGGLFDFGYKEPSVTALPGGGFAISSDFQALAGSTPFRILVNRYDANGTFVDFQLRH